MTKGPFYISAILNTDCDTIGFNVLNSKNPAYFAKFFGNPALNSSIINARKRAERRAEELNADFASVSKQAH